MGQSAASALVQQAKILLVCLCRYPLRSALKRRASAAESYLRRYYLAPSISRIREIGQMCATGARAAAEWAKTRSPKTQKVADDATGAA